jgi:nonribosomal peptide synthetase DhbF
MKSCDVERNLAEVLAARAGESPGRAAVVEPGQALTYGGLDAQANGIARVLLASVVDSDRPVALLLPSGSALAAAFLGTWKAGFCAAPLDVSQPPARLAQHLAYLEPAAVLTDAGQLAHLSSIPLPRCAWIDVDATPARESFGWRLVEPSEPAVILHTSGSCGQPKGVVQTHRNLLRSVTVYIEPLEVSPDDALPLLASMSGAQGLSTALIALLSGARLCPWEVRSRGMIGFDDWLGDQRASILITSPSLLRTILASTQADKGFAAVRALKLGAEALWPEDVDRFRQRFPRPCRLLQSLSSTETLNMALGFVDPQQIAADGRVPVGRESPGMELLIVDGQGQPVADGQPGQIVARSSFLSPGYWRQPEATAAAFWRDSHKGEVRYYRTGDLGLRLADGRIVHCGRADRRVKIRGNRVEVGDVERFLRAENGIADCAVAVERDGAGDPLLAAYFVPAAATCADARTLRARLSAVLPQHMIPAHFVPVVAIPYTANGKVDRAALAQHAFAQPPAPPPREPTPAEARMIAVWSKVFPSRPLASVRGGSARRPVGPIGLESDFFELGGDSLCAMVLLARVQEEFGVAWPPSALHRAPTPAAMAALLDCGADEPEWSSLVPLAAGAAGPPLFCVHGVGGHTLRFVALARALAPHCVLYGLEAPGLQREQASALSMRQLAETYVRDIRAADFSGPHYLAGYSVGGQIAMEMAARLSSLGQTVPAVFVLDMLHPRIAAERRRRRSALTRLRDAGRRWVGRQARFLLRHVRAATGRRPGAVEDRVHGVYSAILRAAPESPLPGYNGLVVLLQTESRAKRRNEAAFREQYRNLVVAPLPGDHTSFLESPHVAELSARIVESMRSIEPLQATPARPLAGAA